MLIAFLAFSSLLAIAALLLVCGYITRNGLRAEVQRLKGGLIALVSERDGLERGYEDMKQIANEALKSAKSQTGLEDCANCGTSWPSGRYWCGKCNAVMPAHFVRSQKQRDEAHKAQLERIEREYAIEIHPDQYRPDPDPNSVKFCPACNVSVRATEWPQECPACHCLFGFAETD